MLSDIYCLGDLLLIFVMKMILLLEIKLVS